MMSPSWALLEQWLMALLMKRIVPSFSESSVSTPTLIIFFWRSSGVSSRLSICSTSFSPSSYFSMSISSP